MKVRTMIKFKMMIVNLVQAGDVEDAEDRGN